MSEKLFSDNPADILSVADDAIEYLKAGLAKFDLTMAPHYDRLRAHISEALDDGDGDRYEDFRREADRYLIRWKDARQPYIQQIQQITMARDGLSPIEVTIHWARKVFGDIAEVPLPGIT